MNAVLFAIGALVAIVAAAAFAALGLLTLYGGARATREQLIPGFRPDRPGPLARALALVAVWVPVLVVTLFALYAAVWIVALVFARQ
ncbi:MAG: hypothetical protein DIU80_012515 [Chloroflexota bacterium]